MRSNICVTTSIRKPKKIVREAIIKTIGIFKDNIQTESKFHTADNFNFRIDIRKNNSPTPISNAQVTIYIQDFPIDAMSYLKVDIQYELSKNDWRTKIKNRLFIRPSIKKRSKESILHFKRKIEKWR